MPAEIGNLGVLSNELLDARAAARHLGFLPEVFNKWLSRGFIPPPSSQTGGWMTHQLDKAIEKILHFGFGIFAPPKASYITISNCQHLRKKLSDDRIVYYMRHCILGRHLPSDWRSPEFARVLIACERELAAAHTTDCAPAPQNQSPTTPQPGPADPASLPKLVTRKHAAGEPESRPAAPAVRSLSDSPSPLLHGHSRRRAAITQADIARIIRAAKQAGATEVEVRMAERSTILIRLQAPTPDTPLATNSEVIL